MKRFTKFAFVLLVLALLLPACNKIDTGIQGQVFLASCNGQEVAVDCTNIEPFEAILTIYLYDETNDDLVVVQTVETKKDGTYAIALDPGTYFIHPQNNGDFPKAADFQVVVEEGKVVELIIQYDTGMR